MVSFGSARCFSALPIIAVISATGCHSPEPQPFPQVEGSTDPSTGEGIKELFARLVDMRHPPGDRHVKRAVFLKPQGCARADFTVLPNLPQHFRVGAFAVSATRKAWVRFSSDTVPTTSDRENNTLGFAIKVMGVSGLKLLPGQERSTTQDFLLQNHPVLFVDTAADFLAFTATVFTDSTDAYLEAHPQTAGILMDMRKEVENALGSEFWSSTPYRFGGADYAKYKAVPCSPRPPEPLPKGGGHGYLRQRLERDLSQDGACFAFQVQLRTRPTMKLDAATEPWSEDESPPRTVARISIPPQDIAANQDICENLSFNPWHALHAHRPVGSINFARGIVYTALALMRRMRNGVSVEEPVE
jgi:hypothetical protein